MWQHRQQALFALLGWPRWRCSWCRPVGKMHTALERAGLPGCLHEAARVEFVQVGPNPDHASV